jgi:hypothetical protein
VSLLSAIAVIVVGFGSGILSGMFGVGGAVLTTPGIRLLGATPVEAIGSTIPAILPGSLSGALRYAKEGLIDYRIALTCGFLGSALAVIGANVSDTVNAHYLLLLTAALLLWSGLKNIRTRRAQRVMAIAGGGPVDAEVATDELTRSDEPSAAAPLGLIAVIGAASGFLAGLLGVGGGVLMVPAFTGLLKLPPKRAVASSLLAVAIFSVPAMVRHAQLGHIHWGFALLLVVGVIPGAQVGAHLTIAGSDRRLRLLMGAFFTVLAMAYGIGELRSL